MRKDCVYVINRLRNGIRAYFSDFITLSKYNYSKMASFQVLVESDWLRDFHTPIDFNESQIQRQCALKNRLQPDTIVTDFLKFFLLIFCQNKQSFPPKQVHFKSKVFFLHRLHARAGINYQ